MLNGSAFNLGSRWEATYSIAKVWIQFYSGWSAFETLASLSQCLKIRLQLPHALLGRAGSANWLMTAWVTMIKRILQAVCENLPSIIGWKLHVFWCRCNVSTRFPQSWISIVGFLYVTSRVQASHCPACFVIDASQSPIVKDPFPNLARQEDPDTSTSLQLSRRCNKHAGLYRLACSCTPSATYIIGWFQFVAILEALHADSSWAMRIVGKRSLGKTMQLSFMCVQCLRLQP